MGLPVGYTQLEYIESTGQEYINTNINPDSNSRIVLDIEILNGSLTTCGIFGARNTPGTIDDCFALWSTSNVIRTDYGSSGMNTNINTLQRLSIDKNKNITNINGQDFTQTQQQFQTLYSFTLFAVNQPGRIDSRKPKARLWSAKLYNNEELQGNYIPCKNSSNIIGVYDTVTNNFLTNAGEGEFIAGPEIAPPNLYVKIDNIWQPISGIYTKINNTW